MTTAEMIFDLHQMAAVNAAAGKPDTHQFLSDVAFRLDRLERLKNHFLESEHDIRFDPGCETESL